MCVRRRVRAGLVDDRYRGLRRRRRRLSGLFARAQTSVSDNRGMNSQR